MSLDKFITDMLNINAEDLEFLDSTKKPDGTMLITIRLKPKPIVCPYCKGAVKIHGYYSRKLVHSALVGRKCVLIYQQHRYKCDSCELIDVLSDRKKPYLMDYLSNIKKDTLNENTHISELDNVKYLSIDLYDNFRDIAKTYFPSAIICADSFHVL